MEEKTKTNANTFQYALAAGLLGLTGLGIANVVIASQKSSPTVDAKETGDQTAGTETTATTTSLKTNNDLLFLNAYDYGMSIKAKDDVLLAYNAVNFNANNKDQNFESLINGDEHGHTVANEVLLSGADETLLSFMRLANDKYVKIATNGDIVAEDKLLAKLILNGKNTPYKQALVGTNGLFNNLFKSEAKNFPSVTWNNEILHGFSEILPKLKQQTKVVYGLTLETIDNGAVDPSTNIANYSAVTVDFETKTQILEYKRNINTGGGKKSFKFNIVFNGDQAPEMVAHIPTSTTALNTVVPATMSLANTFDDSLLDATLVSTDVNYEKETITTVAIDKSENDHDNKFAIMNWDKTVDKIYVGSITVTKIANTARAVEASVEDELAAVKLAADGSANKKIYNFYFNATKQDAFLSVDVSTSETTAPNYFLKATIDKVGVIKN